MTKVEVRTGGRVWSGVGRPKHGKTDGDERAEERELQNRWERSDRGNEGRAWAEWVLLERVQRCRQNHTNRFGVAPL